MDDEKIQDFIKSSFELGKELLEKENLSKAETNFLSELDKLAEIIEG